MYKHILYPIDVNDKYSWKNPIIKLAQLYSLSPDTKITVMNVVQTYGLGMMEEYFPKGWAKEVSQKSLELMKEIFVKNFKPTNKGENYNILEDANINFLVEKGTIYEAILDKSEKLLDNDLILIGSHNPNRSDYLLGPNAAKVVRHANNSVLIVRVEQ
jgi:nucleotide-binding universal stress UspA family protein